MDTSEGAVTEEEDSGDLGSNNNIVCATPDSGEIWHMKQLQQQQQQQQQKWQQPHLFLKQPHYQQQKETFSSIEGLSPIMQLADVASELHRFENQRMSAHHQDVSPHDSTNFLSDMMALCPTIRANEYQWQSQPQQAPLSSAHQPHGGGSSSSSCNSSKSSSEGGTGATTNEVDTTTSSIAFSASISAITNTTRATATTLSSPSLSPSISQHSTGKQARSMHCAADNTTGTAADLFSATPTVTIEAGGAATATTAHHCENGVLSCDSTGTASASL